MTVRNCLLNFFSHLGMFLLPHPGHAFMADKDPKTTEPDELFQKHLKDFVISMNSDTHSVTKKVAGQEISGIDFISLVEAWGVRCRESAHLFPDVKDIRETTVKMQHAMALFTSIALFNENFQKYMDSGTVDVSEEDFSENYHHLRTAAETAFERIPKMKDKHTEAVSMAQLRKNCQSIYEKNKVIHDTQRKMKAAQDDFEREQQKYREDLQVHTEKLTRLEQATKDLQARATELVAQNEADRKNFEIKQKELETEFFQKKMLLEEDRLAREAEFAREKKLFEKEERAREDEFQKQIQIIKEQ